MESKILPEHVVTKLGQRLQKIYKEEFSESFLNRILKLILDHRADVPRVKELWTEKDVVLITYGNSIIEKGRNPLSTLHNFLSTHLANEISCVHILPFFPFSSDDGFSIIDYYKVNSELGDWHDITDISGNFDLMFDLVINHVSQKNEWFQNFLKNKTPGSGYFIVPDPGTDISRVTRPRSSPLLTNFETNDGKKQVWTTFSADQVDLDFSNPEVLYEILNVFLYYLGKGARIIRLDAVAFLWKEPGTTCLHLPETHEIVKLFRDISEVVNPKVILLTETNVPNKENLGYFGNGDEAHMVYQFSLPPLLLYTLHTGNSNYLTTWANQIPGTIQKNTYFNFTASHDGIGVRPLEGLLPKEEIDALLNNMKKFGGKVSYKSNNDGTQSPYEINITYFDALKGTDTGEDNLWAERFICSQTIMLALKGIPAFYIHSLLSTKNDYAGVKLTGRARSINRKKLDYHQLVKELNENETRSTVFQELKRLIKIRKKQLAFHPDANQQIINLGSEFFALLRMYDNKKIIVISNITNKQIPLHLTKIYRLGQNKLKDLITEKTIEAQELSVNPYQSLWLAEL